MGRFGCKQEPRFFLDECVVLLGCLGFKLVDHVVQSFAVHDMSSVGSCRHRVFEDGSAVVQGDLSSISCHISTCVWMSARPAVPLFGVI